MVTVLTLCRQVKERQDVLQQVKSKLNKNMDRQPHALPARCTEPITAFKLMTDRRTPRFPDRDWLQPVNQGCEDWCKVISYGDKAIPLEKYDTVMAGDPVAWTRRLIDESDITFALLCKFGARLLPLPVPEAARLVIGLDKPLFGVCHEAPLWGTNLVYNKKILLNGSMTQSPLSNAYYPYWQAELGERIYNAPAPTTIDEVSAMKPKLIAYASSNFKSLYWDRLEYATKVNSVLKLDSYGAVLHNTEGYGKHSSPVDLYRPYKFVLALENALYDGYVTEKFYNAFLAGSVSPSLPEYLC